MQEKEQSFSNFSEFYPYYLSEHANPTCRLFHFIGSCLVLVVILYALLASTFVWLWAVPIIGYSFAWAGHFFYEHNRPATFKYPFYSFLGDWVMFKDILAGKIKIK